jgi:hypothetical protein
MKKNVVLVQSHCNTEEKKHILIQNINKLKKFDLDILLFSHIPLSEEIIQSVDYFIYDSSNPIMWEERRHYYWWANDKYKLESTVPDYGWTVFNQIIGGFDLIKNKNYEHVIIFCYDVIINETVETFLKNPKSQIFQHNKPPKNNEKGNFLPVVLGTALIFSIFKENEINSLISNLSKKEYTENYDLIAEKYFEKKLKSLNLYQEPKHIVYDSLHESTNVFNHSENPNYEIFVDTVDKLKFVFTKKTQQRVKIIINDSIINVSDNQLFFNENIKELETFGVIIGEIYESWSSFFNSKRINKITFK